MTGALKACHCCGLIHRLPALEANQRARCVRCWSLLPVGGSRRVASSRTAAAAVGALLLFWPAVLLPALEVERLGQRYETSILGGIVDLLQHGNLLVGGIVLAFSILFPLTKIVLLLELSLLDWLNRRHKAFTLRLMEQLGKWSMLDVLLLALLVMMVKLGDLVEFRLGPAVLAFVACVVMNMLASLSFDPHAIWDETPEGNQPA